MEIMDELIDSIGSKKRSSIKKNVTVMNSGYVGMLQPVDMYEVVPGDEIDLGMSYEVNLARCNGFNRNNMVADFYHIFVDYNLIWAKFEDYLWTTPAGANHPQKTIDLSTNTSDGTVLYYMCPQTAGATAQNVSYLPLRAYQKVWYDHFSEMWMKINGLSNPSSFFSTADGTDNTTSNLLRGTSIDNDYYDKLLTSIDSSGSISAPFTLATLQSQIIAERTLQLKKRYSNKIRDLISKLFNVPNTRPDTSIPIAAHRFMLNDMTVLNTSNTNQGSRVTSYYGASTSNAVKYTANRFGLVMVLGVIRPMEICATRNIDLLIDADYKNDAYGYFRPEAQGLAYKQLKVKHFDISQANPTDAMAAENLYDHLRAETNKARGHFSRSTSLENTIARLTGNTLLDYVYFKTDHFTNLFAENPQVTFKVRYNGDIKRAIKKDIQIATL